MTTERLTQILRLRQRLVDATRDFFREQDFLETPTPVRIAAPALEDYIDAEPSGDWFLRTSPELHMKRMLALGCERIFQLGVCFRQSERGRNHLPEFTMLEWYRMHASHEDILADTIAYLRHVSSACLGAAQCPFRGRQIDFAGEWEHLTVDEAFRLYANRDVDEAVAQGDFEETLVSRVEPHLGENRPTVLGCYPLACSGLSRQCADNPNRVERWELYVAGLELGNACSELVDPVEQTRRFNACADLRRSEGRRVYPIDEPFMQALRAGMPPAAGIAIGFDRLLMILADADTLDEVTPFSQG